jgi:hypothetical protein
VSGQHCVLAEGDIGVPIYWRSDAPLRHYYWRTDGFTSNMVGQNKRNKKRGGPNSSVRLTYFQANRLLTQHYKQETEIHRRKDDGHIKN